ncbi:MULTISPECIES: hypothetical protein [Exiguobacterium]|uniref:hypothetical protein n=1 Tax=Exiguobacterium TaxID=33986 RepID=UPI001BEA0959|nr:MULTISPECIES: hypothetical protein [Exiguobacterium]MCT4784182.1 hypothetical protein [Exiguobacterium himgiriensis]
MKKHRKWWSLLFVLMFVLSLLPMKGVVAEESSKQWCVSTTSSKTIFAGQNTPIGTVDFEFVSGGLKIVIDLNEGIQLKDDPENIKIDFRLVTGSLERLQPGQYDFKTYSNSDPTHLLIPYADLASYLGVPVSTLLSDGFQFNVFVHLDTIVNEKNETAYAGDDPGLDPWVRYVTLTVKECTPPPPMDDYDVYTLGCWKNIFNFEKVTFSYGTVLKINGVSYDVSKLSDRQALSILLNPSSKSMTEEKRLIMQLTAAKINVLLNDADFKDLNLVYKDSGVEVGLTVGQLIAGADAALASKNIDQMKYYQKLLDDFNNGLFVGTSHD